MSKSLNGRIRGRPTVILAAAGVLVLAGLCSDRPAIAAEGYPPHPLPKYIVTQQDYTLGLNTDGTVSGDGQVQSFKLWGWTDVASLDAGLKHAVAVTTDGRVYAAGKNDDTACYTSDDLTQRATQWTQMKSVAAGDCFTVGLKNDGTVVGLGRMNGYGQISNLSEWSGIKQIAAGDTFTVGLANSGKVVMKGNTANGQGNVGAWTNIMQIAAGDTYIMGLRADGTVVTTGGVDVSGWKDIVWISAGSSVAAGVTKDGKVVTAGYVFSEIQAEMDKWTDIIQVSIRSQSHAVAVRKNGQAVAAAQAKGFNYKPKLKWALKQYAPQTPGSVATPSSPRKKGPVLLQWTPPEWGLGSDRYYQVEFYDGSAWTQIGDRVTGTEFTYDIPASVNTSEAKFRVRAGTEYGLSEYVTTNPIVIDNQPPQVPVITVSSEAWSEQPVQVTIAESPAVSGVDRTEYWLNGGLWQTYTAPFTIEADGETKVEARTWNKLGEVSEVSAKTVRVDRLGPEPPAVTADASGWTRAEQVTVTVADGADAGIGVLRSEVRLVASDGTVISDWAPYVSPLTIREEGRWTVRARTVDKLNHVSEESALTVLIDRTKPNAPVVTPQTSDWIDAPSVSVAVYGEDGLSGLQRLEYKLSGRATADWTEYTGELRVEAEGETEVRVRAIDKAGNVSDESSAIVRIDRSAPEAPMVTVSESGWTRRDVKVDFAGTDRLSGLLKYQVKLGPDSPWQDVTPGDSVTVTAEGETTVTARAVDRLGHVSAEAAVRVRIDRTAPTVPFLTTDASGWTTGNVTVAVYGSTDAVSGAVKYQYKLGPNGAWTDVPGTGFTVSAEGETPVYVRAADEAGNMSEEAYTVVRIDRTAPTAPVLTPSATSWTNDKVTFTVSGGTDAGSGVARLQYRIGPGGSWTDYTVTAVTVEAEGETAVFARAVDRVGLISEEASAIIRIDRTPPSVPTLSLSESGWTNRPVTFEVYGSTDTGSGLAKYMVKQGANGPWTEYPGTPVEVSSDGETPVFALAVDAAGNRSAEARAVVRIDRGKPVITLRGDNPMLLEVGTPYAEPGAEALDAQDGDLTRQMTVTGSVYSAKLGTYELRYRVSDRTGNTAEATRIVHVVDTTKPVITIRGANPAIVALGDSYTDAGATAMDNYDGDLTNRMTVTGSVYTKQMGIYMIRYSVSDSSGNVAEAVRTVHVVDKESPYIVLLGENPLNWQVGTAYVDPGAKAFDPQDGDLTSRIAVTGRVDVSRLGSYVLQYDVTDRAGNPALPVTRTVRVKDTIRPVITLRGEPEMAISYGTSFVDPGAIAVDNYDGDISGRIRVVGTIDSRKPGVYELRYQVEDSSGNRALEVVRKVRVRPEEEESGSSTPSSPTPVAPAPSVSGPGPAGQPEVARPGMFEVNSPAAEQDLRLTVRGEAFAGALAQARGTDVVLPIDASYEAGKRSVRVDLPAESVVAAAQAAGKRIVLQGAEAGYILTADAVDLSSLAKQLGSGIKELTISVTMRPVADPDRLQSFKRQASEAGYRLIAPVMDFDMRARAGGSAVPLDTFPVYVPKTIKLQGATNPDETTVVRVLSDGSISFVPAIFSGGQATVFSRTNGTYMVLVREKGKFPDIAGHWAEKEIDRLTAKLIVQGMTERSFNPDAEITRAQFAALLTRALGLQPVPPQGRFKDVAGADWHAGTIETALEAGLIGGFDDGTFRPDAPVTREQMAVMIARAMTLSGLKTDGYADKPEETLQGFRDRESISSWARDGVARNVKAGVITGFTDTSYAPNRKANRAEAAVMISRWLTLAQWIN
ncbi:OmpL47-type beta-barrel domain-containing protein [Paenibacillus tyrfis]|uniref:OmpL47-type beta-barrel domain-containing protein n=1 Tax=Paenibacillus tyrfis TaxID=1501230 RepID=UPI001269BC60|nr:immunoglobulin-like domain-containing protein [Paenibacillus tyrfis]